MAVDISMTPTEVSTLYKEKIDDLQEKRNQAEREGKAALERLDKTNHEVTTLYQEKTKLINELDAIKQDAQRVTDTLAEHRKNLEASLAAQETRAMAVIEQAAEKEASIKAGEQAVRQHREQAKGIKQTFLKDVSAVLAEVTVLAQKAQDALAAIPD